jgi:hypothetical protein
VSALSGQSMNLSIMFITNCISIIFTCIFISSLRLRISQGLGVGHNKYSIYGCIWEQWPRHPQWKPMSPQRFAAPYMIWTLYFSNLISLMGSLT